MSNNKQLVEMLPSQYSLDRRHMSTAALANHAAANAAVNAEYHRMPRAAIHLYCASPMHPFQPSFYVQHQKQN